MRLVLVFLILIVLATGVDAACAQNPSLAPDDLKCTQEVIAHNHLIAYVQLEVEENKWVKYRYDKYPDMERITTGDCVAYVRKEHGSWEQSSDWGKSGKATSQQKEAEFDQIISVVNSAFATPDPHDPSQGGTVWKFIKASKEKDYE